MVMRETKVLFLGLFVLLSSTIAYSQHFCVEIIEPEFEAIYGFIDGISPAKKDGKWGLIDLTGDFIIQPEFDEIGYFQKDVARVVINKKVGIIDRNGQIIVEPIYDEVATLPCGIFLASSGDKYFYLDKSGKRTDQQQYDSLDNGQLYGMKCDKVFKNGKCGLVDSTGLPITEIIYDEVYEYEGEIYAYTAGKTGILNKDKTWKVQPQFDELYEFYNGLSAAKIGGSWGLISINGKWKIKNDYDNISYNGGKYVIATKNGLDGILDTSGNWIIEPKYATISFYKGEEFIASTNEKTGLIDTNGNWISDFIYPTAWHYSHDLFQYYNEGLYGLMDREGMPVYDFEFDEIGFMFDGVAYINKNSKFGLIDSLGEIILEPIADEEIYFDNDFAQIKVGEFYGLINKKGQYILEPKQNSINTSSDGNFIYSFNTTVSGEIKEEYRVINPKGEYLFGSGGYISDYNKGFCIIFDHYSNDYIEDVRGATLFLDTYSYIGNFSDSTAIVMKDGKVGVIMISDVQTIIKTTVENKVNKWQKKEEFEKYADYTKRVTEESRKQKAEDSYNEITDHLKKLFIEIYPWYDYELSTYDSENESFKITFDDLGEIVLHVPVSEAKGFKANRDGFYTANPVLAIDGNRFIILQIEFAAIDADFRYQYDITNYANYENMALNYNFKPLDLNYQTNNNYTNNYQKPINSTDPVDINIPVTNKVLENTFAVVIGNERYKNEQTVVYAENDARIFKEYLVKTLGIPENRVHYLSNASLGEMLGEIEWLKNTAKAYEGEAKIIFYYAGHGMPEAESDEAYLLPVDGSSSNSKTGIKLSYLYEELSTNPTESTIVFLDACFSGASREGMLASGRGTRISPKDVPINGNLLVMSAASGTQTAHPFTEKAHGLFTYYLLLKLQQSEGNINYGELFKFVQTNVKRTAVEINKEQDPSIKAAPAITDKWESLKIK